MDPPVLLEGAKELDELMDTEHTVAEALRIVIFHGGLTATGGEERLVLEQALGLRRAGHMVDCYCLVLDRRACHPELIGTVGPRRLVPFVPGRGVISKVLSIGSATLLAPLIAPRFRNADIFVGSNQSGGWIAYRLARLLGKPYLIYRTRPSRSRYRPGLIRGKGQSKERSAGLLPRMIAGISARLDARVMASSDAVLAPGRHLADRLTAQYGREVTVCAAGCHPQSRRLLRVNLETVDDGAFKLAGQIIDKPYLLVTSRHEARSRMESIIDVLARVKEEVPGIVLVITGAHTSHTGQLMRRARELGIENRIVFTGSVSESDLQRLYREAAAYCHPEHYGGTGLGVVEAMAWGVPVVAWNHAATRASIEDGKTGFLPEPNNVEAFADALSWLLQDRRLQRNLGLAGWQRAKNRFTWDHHAQVLAASLHEALEQSGEGRDAIDPEQQRPQVENQVTEEPLDAPNAHEDGDPDDSQLPAQSVESPAWAEANTEPIIYE